MTIKFTRQVQSLPASVPFVGPETLERQSGQTFLARIGANESAFGISELAANAITDSLNKGGCSWYCDPENHELRSALALKHGVSPGCICVDGGIDALLGLTVRMLMEPNDVVVTSHGAYPTFNYHVSGFGGTLKTVPYKNAHESPEDLLAAGEQHRARLIYISNPDNPMGTWHPATTIQAMIDSVPEHATLLLDEAYIDFAEADAAPAFDTSNPNLIRYRTFSKAYGMAGMRIGYAIAHEDIISGFNRIRNHFASNRLSQIAALASLGDSAFLPKVLSEVQQGRQRVYDFAQERSLTFLPSATNFVAVDMHTADKAASVLAELNRCRVFIRKPAVSPLDRFIRVGVGTESEHNTFVTEFDKATKS